MLVKISTGCLYVWQIYEEHSALTRPKYCTQIFWEISLSEDTLKAHVERTREAHSFGDQALVKSLSFDSVANNQK